MIDFERKLIFIHIPKTAGSSIESVLLDDPRILDHDDTERTELIQGKYKKQFCGIHHPHANLQKHRKALGKDFKHFTVFTVVRNPWSSAFSRFCYIFKHKEKNFFNQENFKTFLSIYTDANYWSLLGRFGENSVQYVLNYHNLENEMNQMLSELNMPTIKLPMGNTSQSSKLDYRQYYDADTIQSVSDQYAYDILRFGWKFDNQNPNTSRYKDLALIKKVQINTSKIKAKICKRIEHRRRRWSAQTPNAISVECHNEDLKSAIVCTHPPSLSGLQATIASIIDQVDKIYVYLNNIEQIPEWLNHSKINAVLSKDALGDLKSNGRYYFSKQLSGYCFSIDDDIIYPSNYVETMIEKIESYQRKALICAHGSILRYPFKSYYMSRIVLRYDKYLNRDIRVDLGACGTLAYHTDTIQFSLSDFEDMNMDDIYSTLKAARNNVPIISIQRKSKWLNAISGTDQSHTIFFNREQYNEDATALINANKCLFERNDIAPQNHRSNRKRSE